MLGATRHCFRFRPSMKAARSHAPPRRIFDLWALSPRRGEGNQRRLWHCRRFAWLIVRSSGGGHGLVGDDSIGEEPVFLIRIHLQGVPAG
jgi:hypothetical protein